MPERANAELCLFLECHGTVLALPIRRVQRLLLGEELSVTETGDDVAIATAHDGRYAAWNLGRLLDLPPLNAAWVLLHVPHQGTVLPLALNTGRCLLVAPLARSVTSLPPGMFRDRHNALWGTFPTSDVKGAKLAGPMGLCLDPLRLWHGQELERSASALLDTPS